MLFDVCDPSTIAVVNDSTQLIDDEERPSQLETLVEPVIGDRYRIVDKLGEGGFGVVFEAEQLHPVRRKVALKVVKLGMDTREVIARFEAERQTLALMDHPHIASVLDAGATASGRPYFVMELVAGEPLTTFCDRQGLSISQRLRVFEQVCQAVQHAHTKGIIHRDLKPSNVLASMFEGLPFVKVIDFGIAKATSSDLVGSAKYTAQHAMIGTPEYMSPEQAEGRGDIDTRTDVYALGVLLYELLTGATPFANDTLDSASVSEMQRIIRTIDPVRPSLRLQQSQETLREAAAGAGTEPVRLKRLLRGELDWIVMRALEKDRDRRYQTASAIAEDVERFLSGLPVLAAPPSVSYRARTFVRRNKVVVLAASLVALSLLGGIVGFGWQARIAQQQARLAEQRTAELAQVAKFQAEMLSQVSPLQAGKLLSVDVQARHRDALADLGLDDSVRLRRAADFEREWRQVNATDTARQLIVATVLKPAVRAIDREFQNQPTVAASLREVVAERYRGMELFDESLALHRQALQVRSDRLGADDPVSLRSASAVGLVLRDLGRLEEAEPYYHLALEGFARQLGENHSDTLLAMRNMGALLRSQGRLAEAERYYRQALLGFRQVLGNDDPVTLTAVNNLGLLLKNQGQLEEARYYYEEALAKNREILGPEHIDTLVSIHNMGRLLQAQGDDAGARSLYVEGLDLARHARGTESLQTLIFSASLGSLLVKIGEYAEAIALMAPVEAATRESYSGSNAFRIARLLTSLGQAHIGLEQMVRARVYLEEARAIYAISPGSNPADAQINTEALRSLH